MDRFVVREPRTASELQQGNPMMAVSITSGSSNIVCADNPFYQGSYANEYPNLMRNPSFSTIPHQISAMAPSYHRTDMLPSHMQPGITPAMSGIDPNYLASYNQNAMFIATGQQSVQRPTPVQMNPFGSEYQNRSLLGAERSAKQFVQHGNDKQIENDSRRIKTTQVPGNVSSRDIEHTYTSSAVLKTIETNVLKTEVQNQVPLLSRAEKLKVSELTHFDCGTTRRGVTAVLQKTGPRSFSGPVEKVLKWHKALQDIGILVIYEIVGKCVSVGAGASCARTLVVRDDGGPAVQLVYYEVDFLLPEITPPCTVRVLGRMLAGTSRLQAFSVRPASGDDVAMLPRRAAVAAHHVAKLCKEYGSDRIK